MSARRLLMIAIFTLFTFGVAATVTVLDAIPPGSAPLAPAPAPVPPTLVPGIFPAAAWTYGLHDPCVGVRTWGATVSPFVGDGTALLARMSGCNSTCGSYNVYKDYVFGSPLDRAHTQVKFDAEFKKSGPPFGNRAFITFQFYKPGVNPPGPYIQQIVVGYDTSVAAIPRYIVPAGDYAFGTWQFGIASLSDAPDKMRVNIHVRSCTTGDAGQVILDNILLLDDRVTDTTPPVITHPDSMTLEATSAAGAVVDYDASALDEVDGAVAVSCVPASGSTFALGTTEVMCTATDAASNAVDSFFDVFVVDTTPPVLTVPADIDASATNGAGATVNFTATASDSVDSSVAVTCVPTSGSTFPIGMTTVTCTAVDDAGNSSQGPFKVTVVVTLDGIEALIRNYVSNRGIANSLIVKLGNGAFGAFRNEVAAQTGKALTATQASELLLLVSYL